MLCTTIVDEKPHPSRKIVLCFQKNQKMLPSDLPLSCVPTTSTQNFLPYIFFSFGSICEWDLFNRAVFSHPGPGWALQAFQPSLLLRFVRHGNDSGCSRWDRGCETGLELYDRLMILANSLHQVSGCFNRNRNRLYLDKVTRYLSNMNRCELIVG